MSVQRDREQAEHQEGPDDFGPIPKSRMLVYIELAEAVDALLAEYDRTMVEYYEKPGVVFFDRLRAARAALEETPTATPEKKP